MVSRPYMYSNTPMDVRAEGFQALGLPGSGPRGYTVRVPAEPLMDLADADQIEALPADDTFTVDHKRLQYPFMPTQSAAHSGSYCHGMIARDQGIRGPERPGRRSCGSSKGTRISSEAGTHCFPHGR
jgi:hypothetical protein